MNERSRIIIPAVPAADKAAEQLRLPSLAGAGEGLGCGPAIFLPRILMSAASVLSVLNDPTVRADGIIIARSSPGGSLDLAQGCGYGAF